MFRTILVPTDGSALSQKAADAAIGFAAEAGSRIIALYVVEPYHFIPVGGSGFTGAAALYEEKAHEVAEGLVRAIQERAAQSNVPCEMVVETSPSPWEEIIAVAQRHACDAIFMASHGRKGLSKLIAGSQTQHVLANSTIPVLVIR